MNILLSEGSSSPSMTPKCHNCGSELLQDASYCHRCGAATPQKSNNSNTSTTPSRLQDTKRPEYSNIGLLLIKIGAILAFILPFAAIAGISGVVGYNTGSLFRPLDGLFLGALIAIVTIGIILGIIALRFHTDIVEGKTERIVHTIILGIVMFVLGANVAGVLYHSL